jgi:hypothetical protein
LAHADVLGFGGIFESFCSAMHAQGVGSKGGADAFRRKEWSRFHHDGIEVNCVGKLIIFHRWS